MRLSNTNNFSASFNVATPYQMVVIHSSKLIYPRELYQRGIQRKRVELIARDFNEYTANEPKISFRNGRYYVTDGQHTIEARILRNGGKDLPILCKVYTGLTMQQEALFFAEQNGHAAPLTAGIKLRAKVVGEDALSMAFLAATNRVGLDFNYGCPGYGLPDKLGLAHVVGRKPFCKLGVFFLGHVCFDYPAAVRCVVSFSHGKTSFRLPHGCGGISGVSRMAGFGEGTPPQDSRRGKMSEKRILVLR